MKPGNYAELALESDVLELEIELTWPRCREGLHQSQIARPTVITPRLSQEREWKASNLKVLNHCVARVASVKKLKQWKPQIERE